MLTNSDFTEGKLEGVRRTSDERDETLFAVLAGARPFGRGFLSDVAHSFLGTKFFMYILDCMSGTICMKWRARREGLRGKGCELAAHVWAILFNVVLLLYLIGVIYGFSREETKFVTVCANGGKCQQINEEKSVAVNCGELAQTVGQLLAILVESITLCRRWEHDIS